MISPRRPRPADRTAAHAVLFRALAEPNRLRIVYCLLEREVCSVLDLVRVLGAEQSLVSHHLALLRRRGLVTARRAGRSVRYRLAARVRGALAGRTLDLGCCTVTFRHARSPS